MKKFILFNIMAKYESCQCYIQVYNLNASAGGESIYAIKTTHKSNGKVYIRFGNAKQIKQILDTYNLPRNQRWRVL